MSQITVGTFDYQYTQGPYVSGEVELRLWYTGGPGQQFIDSLGNTVPYGNAGQFYDAIPCTFITDHIEVPAFTIPSTDDSSNISSVAHAQFYVNGSPAEFLFTDWIITNTLGATVAYSALYTYNLAASIPYQLDPLYLQAPSVAALIAIAVGTLNDASPSVKGRTKISVPALVASSPIAASDNDHRLVSTIYNVDAYPYYAVGDGVTDDSAAIQAALDAAEITGGTVYLPAESYSIGSAGLSVPSNVVLASPSYKDQPNLFYSGTGVAVDTLGSFYAGLANLYVKMTNAAATGFRWGKHSQWCWAKNLTANGIDGNLSTGRGFDFDADTPSPAEFSGQFYGRSLYSLSNKYGITVEGTATANDQWTTITLERVTIVGTGIASGSVGIKTDTHSNLEGSTINGLAVESCQTVFDWGNAAGAYGFTVLNMGNENNGETIPSFPAGWSGSVYDPHNDGYYQRSSSNGLTNLWDREKLLSGEWITESINRKLHVLYDGSQAAVRWGVLRGGSVIGGELARDKFVVSTGSQFSSSYVINYTKLLEFKTAYNTAAPTDGSWGIGSQIWNSTPGVGLPTGWVCNASGTFKTALAGVTGSITGGSQSLVVNSVSTMEVGDYISIVGVAGTKLITAISAVGPTITIDSIASAPAAGAIVQYVTPTFQANDNLGTARSARNNSQFDVTSNVALADITGLSVMVEAGFTYTFTAHLYTSSNVAGGVKCAVGGSFTSSSFRADALVFDTNTVTGPSRATSKGSALGAVTAVTAASIQITGTITITGSGTLTLQFAQNASSLSASSVLIGSSLEVQLIG